MLVPEFGRLVLLCRGKIPSAQGMAAYERDGYEVFHQPKIEYACFEMLVFRVCDVQALCLPDIYDIRIQYMI